MLVQQTECNYAKKKQTEGNKKDARPSTDKDDEDTDQGIERFNFSAGSCIAYTWEDWLGSRLFRGASSDPVVQRLWQRSWP